MKLPDIIHERRHDWLEKHARSYIHNSDLDKRCLDEKLLKGEIRVLGKKRIIIAIVK